VCVNYLTKYEIVKQDHLSKKKQIKKKPKKTLKTSVPMQKKNPFLPTSKTLQKNTKIFQNPTLSNQITGIFKYLEIVTCVIFLLKI
jgi:hypothetical protein